MAGTLFSGGSNSARVARAVPKRVTLMPRPKCTAAWLLLIPAFAAAQTTETPPARHDTVEVPRHCPHGADSHLFSEDCEAK